MPKKILLVDDEPDTRELLKIVLKDYELDTTKDGDECMQAALKKKYDLILLDIMMPGMPADKIVDAIGRSKTKYKPKIAYFSVVEQPKEKLKKILERKHVVDYILKPVTNEELRRRVKKILGA